MTEQHSACPEDEVLVAYLTSGLRVTERPLLETHVRECSRCVQALATVQRRLSIADEIPAIVPVLLAERVRPVAGPERRTMATERRRRWLETMWEQMASLLRPPVLVPAAVAAGAILVLVSQSMQQSVQPDDLRAVPSVSQQLRVRVPEAPVLSQPTTRGRVIATIHRGTAVVVRGEERDWYQIVLPDGTEGWVERETFE